MTNPLNKHSRGNLTNFGRKAVAAMFELDEAVFNDMVRRRAFPAPDFVSEGDARWLMFPTLVTEVKNRAKGGLEGVVFAMQALLRTEHAEGLRDE